MRRNEDAGFFFSGYFSILEKAICLPVMLCVLLNCALFSSGKVRPSLTTEAERLIEKDPRYREADGVCREIIPPNESDLLGKGYLGNSVGILYYYQMKISNDQAEVYFDKVMLNGEWVRTKNNLLSRVLSYKKNGFEVNITLEWVHSNSNLAISCIKSK